MAIYVPSHKLCFIHNPKTGGSSIQQWLFTHTDAIQPKNTLHCNLDIAKTYFNDITTSFAVVRNPWDWCVSWYFYQIKRAQNNLNFINNHPEKVDPRKEKYSKDAQIKILQYLDKGFEYWLTHTNHTKQLYYLKDIQIILKFENLNTEFQKIKNILKIDMPLPMLNVTSKNIHYSHYYNNKTINLVYNKYNEDILTFGYNYETP